jgi:hypothetical protein
MLGLRRSSVSSLFVETEAVRAKAEVTEEELETGLRFWHEVGMCLWYESSAALREYVFHDPVQVSELLRVLVDRKLVEERIDQACLLSMQQAAQCLQLEQLTVQIPHVLWAELLSAQNPPLSVERFGQLSAFGVGTAGSGRQHPSSCRHVLCTTSAAEVSASCRGHHTQTDKHTSCRILEYQTRVYVACGAVGDGTSRYCSIRPL